jgi:hypothetical protein
LLIVLIFIKKEKKNMKILKVMAVIALVSCASSVFAITEDERQEKALLLVQDLDKVEEELFTLDMNSPEAAKIKSLLDLKFQGDAMMLSNIIRGPKSRSIIKNLEELWHDIYSYTETDSATLIARRAAHGAYQGWIMQLRSNVSANR